MTKNMNTAIATEDTIADLRRSVRRAIKMNCHLCMDDCCTCETLRFINGVGDAIAALEGITK